MSTEMLHIYRIIKWWHEKKIATICNLIIKLVQHFCVVISFVLICIVELFACVFFYYADKKIGSMWIITLPTLLTSLRWNNAPQNDIVIISISFTNANLNALIIAKCCQLFKSTFYMQFVFVTLHVVGPYGIHAGY